MSCSLGIKDLVPIGLWQVQQTKHFSCHCLVLYSIFFIPRSQMRHFYQHSSIPENSESRFFKKKLSVENWPNTPFWNPLGGGYIGVVLIILGEKSNENTYHLKSKWVGVDKTHSWASDMLFYIKNGVENPSSKNFSARGKAEKLRF